MSLRPTVAMRLAVLVTAVSLAFAFANTAAAQTGDVDIVLDRFGVGSAYRPGEVVAMRLELSVVPGAAIEPGAPVWVHIEVPNADGDIAEYGRATPIQPDSARSVWLYFTLPPDEAAPVAFPVRVFDFTDGKRGRELGATRIRPTGQAAPANAGLIGVIGQRRLGLEQYTWPRSPDGPVPCSLEDTLVIAGISPRELCDRWEGLRAFEAIAWGEASPLDLAEGAADALREWVRRGGHLILTLPEDGNPWGLGDEARTPLADLFPSRAPRIVEDVPLSKLLPILGKSRGLIEGDFPLTVRVFDDLTDEESLLDNGWEPIVVTPEGQVVAIQRTFGYGRLTIVGIDLTLADLALRPLFENDLRGALPEADAFWNRILGRRGDTPSASAIGEIAAKKRLSNHQLVEFRLGSGSLFREPINMSGEAGKGLLMALAIFAIYWLVAGPVGHGLLRAKGWVRHSWLAFAAAAAVFTGVAWTGATWLRRNDVMVDHFTVLDRIARPAGAEDPDNDPQLARAASWFSVYLPGYSDAKIGLQSDEGSGLRYPAQRDLLWSWTPPDLAVQLFPNVDRYVVDVNRNVDDFSIPRRSTATQLYAHWLGPLDSSWGTIFREKAGDAVRVEMHGNEEVLKGTIISDLPRTLEHVKIVWVKSNRISTPRYQFGTTSGEMPWVLDATSGAMLNSGEMWGDTPIEPGEERSLGGTTGSLLELNLYKTYIEEREDVRFGAVQTSHFGQPEQRKRVEMLSLFHQLRPPRYLREPDQPPPPRMVADRLLAREIDLSAWFNRPCVIVMGWMDAADLPFPLLVEGEPVKESAGTVFVRWIRPLELEDSVAFDLDAKPDDASEEP